MHRFATLLVVAWALGVAAPSPAAPPRLAPSWELLDLEGTAHRLEDWRGRWMLLKLGTTQCPNCTRQLEDLAEIRDRVAALGVDVVDVYLRQDRYTVKKYWKKKASLPYQPLVLCDWRGGLIRDYKVSIIPHLVLVDPSGRVAWEAQYTPANDLLEVLERHASPPAGSSP